MMSYNNIEVVRQYQMVVAWILLKEMKKLREPKNIKSKSTFNPTNKHIVIKIYMSNLEEKLMEIEIKTIINLSVLVVKKEKFYTI